MKWKLTLPESTMLVYYLVKLTGLAPFTLKKNQFQPPTLLDKLYLLFVVAGYVFLVSVTFTPALATFYTVNYSAFMKLWGTILYLTSTGIIFTLIIFLLMYEKIVYLMNKLCIVSNELKSLGIEEDDEKMLKNLFVTVVTANATLIATCAILIWMEPNWPIFLSIKYCIDSWIGLHTVLIFVQILACIRQRFILVNERLCNLLTPDPYIKLPRHLRIFVASSEGLTDLQRIWKIEALHLELCDLVDRTTHIFATPIFLNSLRLSAQFMLSSYWIYFLFRNPNYFEIGSIVCTVLKMVITIVLLLIIACASAMTGEQGNATKIVLCKVWIKFRPVELRDEFFMFSTQLLRTPVAVSAFGFIDLDYSFVLKIFSIVVTYLIVMIQLES